MKVRCLSRHELLCGILGMDLDLLRERREWIPGGPVVVTQELTLRRRCWRARRRPIEDVAHDAVAALVALEQVFADVVVDQRRAGEQRSISDGARRDVK